MKRLPFLALIVLLSFTNHCFGQLTDKEMAELQAKQALILEDNGKVNEAIDMLTKAQQLDSTNINYPYEIAYAYNLKRDYSKVSQILEKLIQRTDANGKIYHLLGNTYDNLKQPEKAIETYQAGLKRFPNSGELYLELGNNLLNKKDYKGAVSFYEKGIQMDPMFPSNYYRAAKMFLVSNEKAWGMLYGEIFLLLEYNGQRTAEINKLLYDTYKNQITRNADGSYTAHFGYSTIPDAVASRDSLVKKLPFTKSVYEPLLALGLNKEKTLDINSLSRARKIFTEFYFKTDIWQNYPSPLMDYQYKVLKAGHSDAYNHWVLAEGNHVDFTKWQAANKDKYTKFIKWFLSNPLKLDDKYKFYREQY